MTTDVAQAPGSVPPSQPKKSGVLKWLLIGGAGCALVLFLLVGGCVGALFYGLAEAKKQPVYVHSLQKVQADKQAQAILGTPITGGTPSQFKFNTTPSSNTASVTYGVEGPKGSGTVQADGSASGNQWTFSKLVLTANGKTIDLLVSSGGAIPAEAPVNNEGN